MKKKIFIGIGVFILLVVIGLFWLNNRNRTLSPPGNVSLTSGNLTITIPYSRPSVRGRVIFGTKEQGAIQPFGQYWRLGANESTEITFSRDASFNGQPVKAGTYKIYAVPGPESFELVLNSELGKWGAMEPDYDKDVMKTSVPTEKLSSPIEQYTITLVDASPGIDVVFEFSDTKFVLPIR